MRRWLTAAVVLAASMLFALPAFAAKPRDPLEPGPLGRAIQAWAEDYEWMWEGQVTGVVFDDDVFKDVFRDDMFVMARSGLNWYPVDDVTLGFYLGAMFETGHAIGEITGERSGEDTDLMVIPVQLNLAYRFDYYEDQPIVPSVWIGGDWWYFQENNEYADNIDGDKMGWHWGADLAFLLDSADSRTASRLMKNFGIEDTYMVLGYEYASVGASEDGIDFSGSMYTLGLRFEIARGE